MRLLSDAWITAQIDEVVAPYAGRLSTRDLAWMREELAHTLASSDVAAALLKGARPRQVDQSGEVECEPIDDDDEASSREPIAAERPARLAVVKPSKAG